MEEASLQVQLTVCLCISPLDSTQCSPASPPEGHVAWQGAVCEFHGSVGCFMFQGLSVIHQGESVPFCLIGMVAQLLPMLASKLLPLQAATDESEKK